MMAANCRFGCSSVCVLKNDRLGTTTGGNGGIRTHYWREKTCRQSWVNWKELLGGLAVVKTTRLCMRLRS